MPIVPATTAPELVIEETLCCGYKRCPTVRVYADGSVDVSDNGQAVRFNPDQARALRVLLTPR